MELRFLLKDVSIAFVEEVKDLNFFTYKDQFIHLNEKHFVIYIPNLAKIKASNGISIEIEALGETIDKKGIELYLNGSVLAALLYQRGVMTFHGSSIEHNGGAILICGDSGAGKSSATLGLCINYNHQFLTDDVSPVLFENNVPMIWSISERLKLWEDTLDKLNQKSEDLERVRCSIDKYFMELKGTQGQIPLTTIVFLSVAASDTINIAPVEGHHLLDRLLHALYRKEFFDGLKKLHVPFFERFVSIADNTACYDVVRGEHTKIEDLIAALEELIIKK